MYRWSTPLCNVILNTELNPNKMQRVSSDPLNTIRIAAKEAVIWPAGPISSHDIHSDMRINFRRANASPSWPRQRAARHALHTVGHITYIYRTLTVLRCCRSWDIVSFFFPGRANQVWFLSVYEHQGDDLHLNWIRKLFPFFNVNCRIQIYSKQILAW